MKRFYLRLRVMLMMLAFGLASVNFFNWFNDYWYEIPVNLPEVESKSPIIVLPRKWGESPLIPGGSSGGSFGDGYRGGANYINEKTRRNKKVKNKKLYSSNESIRKSN